MKLSFLVIIPLLILPSELSVGSDYYELLGVSRDATVKEIRKAFKTLAVKLHPDKNKKDENAEDKFIKLAKAYEVLKDVESRKHYDLYGDTTQKKDSEKRQYHSYTYYRDQFGIYDDDPLIVTLSRHDYEVNVLDDTQAWFVNFYSPNCHHCHDLAPTWRKLAVELEGVIRVAAVNCEDDFALCYQLKIESYPTLIYYEKESHLYEGIPYRGPRELKELKDFVFSKIQVEVREILPNTWDELKLNKLQWLLFLCPEHLALCPESETMLKLSAILEGLVSVGRISDSKLSQEISENYETNPIIFWQIKDNGDVKKHPIQGADSKEILDKVLEKLPNPETLDENNFQEIRMKLRLGANRPWLLCFYLGPATELNLQLKRLPTLTSSINIGLIHCGKSSGLCSSLHVVRYPTWGVLKVGGAFELHHGRDVLHEVAAFARDSTKATNLHALSPADFANLKNEGSTWFIDWYAPWCPPCKKLMPELRKASQHFEPESVQFGTVDCTLHRNLCSKEGINAYPTTLLYNGTTSHHFHGIPNEDSIVEFVQDMLNPTILTLDSSNFIQLMRKPLEELWVVDFYAPWCGPCQKLAQEWRKLAKQMKQFPEVKIAHLNCDANSDLCESQNIRGYPTIRLYPLGSKGLNTVAIHNGNRDLTSLKRWVLSFLPSPVEQLTSKDFREQILNKRYAIPWLVDFYAPWCGHCTNFEPEFRIVAQKLEGIVRTAKIDCEAERVFCGHQQITGYPTIRLYLTPTEHYKIHNKNAAQMIEIVKQMIVDYQHSQRGHDEL